MAWVEVTVAWIRVGVKELEGETWMDEERFKKSSCQDLVNFWLKNKNKGQEGSRMTPRNLVHGLSSWLNINKVEGQRTG